MSVQVPRYSRRGLAESRESRPEKWASEMSADCSRAPQKKNQAQLHEINSVGVLLPRTHRSIPAFGPTRKVSAEGFPDLVMLEEQEQWLTFDVGVELNIIRKHHALPPRNFSAKRLLATHDDILATHDDT